MKRVAVMLILLAGLSGVGCDNAQQKPSFAERMLGGEHKLRKMGERIETSSRISGGYFLFWGSLEGSATTNVTVTFAWRLNDGTYAISSLPIEKIRIAFNEKAETPTIKFGWGSFCWGQTIQELMDSEGMLYAVVTIRENDWPTQINLPLNNPQPK